MKLKHPIASAKQVIPTRQDLCGDLIEATGLGRFGLLLVTGIILFICGPPTKWIAPSCASSELEPFGNSIGSANNFSWI